MCIFGFKSARKKKIAAFQEPHGGAGIARQDTAAAGSFRILLGSVDKCRQGV